jgi:hypothetical protein
MARKRFRNKHHFIPQIAILQKNPGSPNMHGLCMLDCWPSSLKAFLALTTMHDFPPYQEGNGLISLLLQLTI